MTTYILSEITTFLCGLGIFLVARKVIRAGYYDNLEKGNKDLLYCGGMLMAFGIFMLVSTIWRVIHILA